MSCRHDSSLHYIFHGSFIIIAALQQSIFHHTFPFIGAKLIQKSAFTFYINPQVRAHRVAAAFSRADDKPAERKRVHMQRFCVSLILKEKPLFTNDDILLKYVHNASCSYRALVHACPHRIYIRFIFLNHNLKLSIRLLSFSVVELISLNALGASRCITARSHV